jgi:MFS family permease
LRERAPSYAAALVLTLLFMGATLPSPLYVMYRDELHFSQVTLTLIYAVYFAGAMATAFFLGRISDETGRRVAILGQSPSASSHRSFSSSPTPSTCCSSAGC